MNGFYIFAGLLLILLSIAHVVWGERRVFNAVTSAVIGQENFVSLYVPWYQIAFVLFASGVGMILSAAREELAFLPYFILAVVAGNFIVFILSCIVKRYTELFRKTIPQTILFLLLMVVIVLGIIS